MCGFRKRRASASPCCFTISNAPAARPTSSWRKKCWRGNGEAGMAEGRRGLGRGLSALLEEAQAATTHEARRAAGVQELPIELVRRNTDQPRRNFDGESLQELADSIRERGVIQP